MISESEKNVIVIEGLGGAGKTTVAQLLATRYGYAVFNTGTLFRASAAALSLDHVNNLDATDYILRASYEVDLSDAFYPQVAVNGVDVSPLLQIPSTTEIASILGTFHDVSLRLESIFNLMLSRGRIVAEGKNLSERLGSVASGTFFFVATPEVRARRKWKQAHDNGATNYSIVDARRDIYMNDNRDIRLLTTSEKTQLIDTTEKTPLEVLSVISNIMGLSSS